MNCTECKLNREMIPYVAHEAAMARAEHAQKRLWITILLLIFFLVGSNMAWIYYESQFETVTTTVEQDSETGYNNYIGNDGDIFNGETEDNHH